MALDLEATLKRRGWLLTHEGIEECSENQQTPSVDTVIQKALNLDLRDIGAKCLPDDIAKGKVDVLDNPVVLQIQKIRNVSAPKANETSNIAPPLLRFHLTDGHITCNALKWDTLKSVSLETPPGTKILLHAGNIQVLSGFLILEEKSFAVLGGHVAHLVEKWEMNRHFSQLHRSGGGSEGGPPPWVNFGQRVDTSLYRNVKGGFRSLSQAHKDPKEDEAFEQQRQANIAEVARIKNEKKKIFGGGKQILDGDIAQVMGKGFSVDQATSALKNHGGDLSAALSSLYVTNKVSGGQNNETRNPLLSRADQNRRREKKNEETDVIQSRPSGPTTLFEFLQNQIPLSDDSKNSGFSSASANSNHSFKATATVANNSPTSSEQQRFRPDSGRSQKDGLSGDKRKFPRKDSGATRYPNQRNSYSGQQQEIYRNKPPYNQPSPSNNRGQDKYSSNKISDNSSKKSNESATSSNKTNNPKQSERKGSKSSFRHEANSAEPNQRAFVNGVKSQHGTIPPQSGEKVLARYWEDGKFYRAVVHAVAHNAYTCVVQFVDYGNYEEVTISDVQQVSLSDWNYHQPTVGQTPSGSNCPPAFSGDEMVHFNFMGTIVFKRGGSKPMVKQTNHGSDNNQGRTVDRSRHQNRPSMQLYQSTQRQASGPL